MRNVLNVKQSSIIKMKLLQKHNIDGCEVLLRNKKNMWVIPLHCKGTEAVIWLVFDLLIEVKPLSYFQSDYRWSHVESISKFSSNGLLLMLVLNFEGKILKFKDVYLNIHFILFEVNHETVNRFLINYSYNYFVFYICTSCIYCSVIMIVVY